MDEEIRILIKGVLGHFVGRRQDFEVERPRCREAVNAMTRAVCEVLEVHRPKYTGEQHKQICFFRVICTLSVISPCPVSHFRDGFRSR